LKKWDVVVEVVLAVEKVADVAVADAVVLDVKAVAIVSGPPSNNILVGRSLNDDSLQPFSC